MRALVVRNNTTLCVRLKKYGDRTGKDHPYWCLPGGGVDVGEALLPALEREMIEETGIAPEIGNLLYIQQFTYNDTEQLEFFFHVTNTDDYLSVDLENTTHGAIEIESMDFIDTTKEFVLPKFLQTEPVTKRIAQGDYTTRIFSYM